MGVVVPRVRGLRILVGLTVAVWQLGCAGGVDPAPIRIGLLHSFTGSMASSEISVAEATRLAVTELNEQGGLLGRQIEIVEADGESSPGVFAAQAERLIVDEQVTAVFGCWTSASRRNVRPVIDTHDHLLFYPLQYEGLEQSTNIIYLGATPNQQILPAVEWALLNRYDRLFLVGSDYVFPRAANEIIKDHVDLWRGEIVGEEYLQLGTLDVEAVIDRIVETEPDIILNTINGLETNQAFFQSLRARGLTSEALPSLSFSLSEIELDRDDGSMVGDYVMWNYLQALATPRNIDFVSRFQASYGQQRPVGDPMASAYIGVNLWAAAVEAAGSVEPDEVKAALRGLSINSPAGMVHVDEQNQHLWKTVWLGQIEADGMIRERWSTGIPIPPEPYPATRTVAEWDAFLGGLQAGWNGAWENPGSTAP